MLDERQHPLDLDPLSPIEDADDKRTEKAERPEPPSKRETADRPKLGDYERR